MKYRVLTPEEMEAYKIGYKVGARELFITGQEWDSEEEKKIYRKGYNAGCKDRERKNLKPELLDECQQCQQCQQCPTCDSKDSKDSVYTIDTNTVNNNNNNIPKDSILVSGIRAREQFVHPTLEEVLEYAQQQNEMAGMGGFKCSQETAEQFWAHYESIGWRIGNDAKTPITNWKPKLRQWATKEKNAPPHETERERKERINREKLEELKRRSEQ